MLTWYPREHFGIWDLLMTWDVMSCRDHIPTGSDDIPTGSDETKLGLVKS